MAFSRASVVKSVFGNKRMEAFVLTADAASGAVDTGLSVIEHAVASPKSANTTSRAHLILNLNSATTALNGSLKIAEVASGDDFHVQVIGR